MASLKTTTTQNDDRELACSYHSSPSVFEEASPRQTHGETERSEAIALGALGGQGVHLSEDSKGPNVKKAFFTLTGAGFLTLVVIWLNAIWLFGSLNQSGSRAARLKVLVADFDQGVIGNSLIQAVSSVQEEEHQPTYEILSANETSVQELRDRVWRGEVWGAVWASAGQSESLDMALTSSSGYDPSQAYIYTGLQSRYFTVWSSYILTSLLQVTSTAGAITNQRVSSLYPTRAGLDATQVGYISNPTGSTFDNQSPMPFTVRVLLNTIGVVLVILFQFFFQMGLNGIFTGFGLYRNTSTLRLIKQRYPVKLVWTLISSLSVAGMSLMFGEGFRLPVKNFFALWAVLWVFAWISYCTISFLLAVVPLAFLTNFILTLIMTSVAATVFPIEVQNVFYRISYIYPSHAYWQVAMTIYGRGSNNHLYIYLPILAAWLVVGEAAALLGEVMLAKKSHKTEKSAH